MDTFNPSQMPPMQSEPEKKSIGPLVAVVIILAIIIIGGLYFLKERASQEIYSPTPTTEEDDSIVNTLNEQDSSDELDSIEADLNATDLDNLDEGAAVIETELQ